MLVHLHNRSWFSFRAGGSSPEDLVAQATAYGQKALAITDVNGVYGAIRFQLACEHVGIKPVFGAEVPVDGATLVLLAASPEGYANLCALLTDAHLRDRAHPAALFEEMASRSGDLWCLTGTQESKLWGHLDAGETKESRQWVGALHDVFGERLSIEVAHALNPNSDARIRQLIRLSETMDVPLVATNDVRHARREDYVVYDLLTCIRNGVSVHEPHAERPRNGERALISEEALLRRLPLPEAIARSAEIAEACNVSLVADMISPPAARIPEGTTGDAYLRKLCEEGLRERFGDAVSEHARNQLEKELAIIAEKELSEFFLVVREIVAEARKKKIRCSGRGSAASSLVAYLLRITNVDTIKYKLVFERFLHRGRKGTPDIDMDFDSERREEIIAWMEQRFGIAQTAMTATVVTYGLRSAVRDVAKAFGWGMETVNALGKAVAPSSPRHVVEVAETVRSVLGQSPFVDKLIETVARLDGCPRHLGQHSGGMVLSRRPLNQFTPIQKSANGVLVTQFAKYDTEHLGLVKLDVLALRMLAAIAECVEIIERHEGFFLDVDALPLDDEPTFEMIRAGHVIGCFQIESQGQHHLLGKHQPEDFNDLITEIALFRPGPLQGNVVDPFVRRRRGEEGVVYDHPSLEGVLGDTYGVIIYQDQVLDVAYEFAGMSLDEADDFRKLMSHFRDPGEMESMRTKFVDGAIKKHGTSLEEANTVFEKVSKFVGYGFCRSHSAAFAQTVYSSCYLKKHFPAAYMAAFMQHRPGFYNLTTLQEEARRFGVETAPPDLAKSWSRYDIEEDEEGKWRIRMPLSALKNWTQEKARMFVFERLRAPFESVEDVYRRSTVGIAELRSLAQSGALDSLAGNARRALWDIGVLEQRLGEPGQGRTPELFEAPAIHIRDIPELPNLALDERLSWDYQAHNAARSHPMQLIRRQLNELEIRPIETCWPLGELAESEGKNAMVTVAGICILRQRPHTANGVLFVTLEDETGYLQTVVWPSTRDRLEHILKLDAIIVKGEVQVASNWRGVVVADAWPLYGAFGGYGGHLQMGGGTDRQRVGLARGRQRVYMGAA